MMSWTVAVDAMRSHLMEVLATPFCGVLACMAIEDGEIALATDIGKVDNKGVRVLHRTSLAAIVCDTDFVPMRGARVLI